MITVVCDDYTHDVTLGPPASQWIAQINDFNPAGLAASRFSGMANSATLYEDAAWLTKQTGLHGGTQQSAATIGEINYAIWKLFDPSLSIDTTAQDWLTKSQNNAPTNMSYYSNVRILTPIAHPDGTAWTDSTSPQEYLTLRLGSRTWVSSSAGDRDGWNGSPAPKKIASGVVLVVQNKLVRKGELCHLWSSNHASFLSMRQSVPARFFRRRLETKSQ